jgi:hypothetical protein
LAVGSKFFIYIPLISPEGLNIGNPRCNRGRGKTPHRHPYNPERVEQDEKRTRADEMKNEKRKMHNAEREMNSPPTP